MSENNQNITLPNTSIWERVSKLAITEDKPIKLDYWLDSLENEVLIGVRENNEKLLVKNEEEYTSPIEKIYKLNDVYIFIQLFNDSTSKPHDLIICMLFKATRPVP